MSGSRVNNPAGKQQLSKQAQSASKIEQISPCPLSQPLQECGILRKHVWPCENGWEEAEAEIVSSDWLDPGRKMRVQVPVEEEKGAGIAEHPSQKPMDSGSLALLLRIALVLMAPETTQQIVPC